MIDDHGRQLPVDSILSNHSISFTQFLPSKTLRKALILFVCSRAEACGPFPSHGVISILKFGDLAHVWPVVITSTAEK
jgi:hypothetical protein